MKSNKIVLITSLITLGALILITVLISVIISLTIPAKMANFCYGVGLENLSQNLYYKDYKKTGSIYSLYSSLKINIELEKNQNIVYRFDEFSSNNEYDSFVENYNKNILGSNNSKLLKASLYNLDNYLKEKYVDAKLKLNNQQVYAVEYSARELYKANSAISFENQGAYLMSNLLEDEVVSIIVHLFKSEIDGKIVFDEMKDYYNNLCNYLDLNKNNNSDDILKITFANRIIKLGNDIITLCNYSSDFSANTDEINSKIINLKNSYISGLING